MVSIGYFKIYSFGDCRGSCGALKAICIKNGFLDLAACLIKSILSAVITSLQCNPPSQNPPYIGSLGHHELSLFETGLKYPAPL